jgi:midasin
MGTLSTTLFTSISEILTLFSNMRLELHKISTNNNLQSSSGFAIFSSLEKLLNSLTSVMEELKTLEEYQTMIDVDKLIENLLLAQSKFKKCYNAVMGKSTTGFEWIDGVVINAVENGHWLVLNNVNLCPASVLDRLNSLLEPNGTLLLTESGSGRMIIQNPNFRIFFTMDQCCGEISRAMRNRCLEISILSTGTLNQYKYIILRNNQSY